MHRHRLRETVSRLCRLMMKLPPPNHPPGELPSDVEGLISEAQRLYDEAQSALDRGDLGTYQQRIDDLAEVLDRLGELTGG